MCLPSCQKTSPDHYGDLPRMPDTTDFEYTVTFRDRGRAAKTIRAAYVRTSDACPDQFEFVHADGKPVAFIAREEVLSVERAEIPERGTSGFKPASQIMDGK
jgi:hypothetical protein